MLSLLQIERLVQAGEFAVLARRVLENGRPDGRGIRLRLSDQGSVVPAAIALALQRVSELSYGRSNLADDLTQRLISQQRPDGLFGRGGTASIAATAVAIRALLTAAEYWDADLRPAVVGPAEAAHRALLALRCELRALGLMIDPIDAAIVLWQLGDQPEFRRCIDTEMLLDAIEAGDVSAAGEDRNLLRLAQTLAA